MKHEFFSSHRQPPNLLSFPSIYRELENLLNEFTQASTEAAREQKVMGQRSGQCFLMGFQFWLGVQSLTR